METERDMVTCRKCSEIKPRIKKGKYNETNHKYVDDNGRAWNGRSCPECNAERVKIKMQKIRLERKVNSGTAQ